MPREFNIVIHTAYDDLYPVDIWSSEVEYMRARNFLKALVGGPHGVSEGLYAGAELRRPIRPYQRAEKPLTRGLRWRSGFDLSPPGER